jgi:hypothetical protein
LNVKSIEKDNMISSSLRSMMKKLVSIVIFLILALASVDAQELITLGAPGKEGELISPQAIKG